MPSNVGEAFLYRPSNLWVKECLAKMVFCLSRGKFLLFKNSELRPMIEKIKVVIMY